MPKKLKILDESELGSGFAVEVNEIAEIGLKTGREDLDQLVDKVNEIIRKINNG